MARRGENIYKRKDGRYEGRYIIGKTMEGKTKFGYVYAKQYSEVRTILVERKAQHLSRSKEDKICGHRLYGEWAQYWLENRIRSGVRSSTYACYRNILDKHILPVLGSVNLTTLSVGEVKQFGDELIHKGLSMSMRQSILRMLTASLRAAVSEGLIKESPCYPIRREYNRCEQRILTRSEQMRFDAAALESRDLPALLGLYLGLRVGEICGLKWSDIDWHERTLTIRRTVQRSSCTDLQSKTRITVGCPKSLSSCRRLPVPDFLLKLLTQRAPADGLQDAYIFGSGMQPIEPRVLQRHIVHTARQLGLSGVHFHTLRHTFATRLLELGVDIKTVSLLLGHSSTRITLECYAHSTYEQQLQAIRSLESWGAPKE